MVKNTRQVKRTGFWSKVGKGIKTAGSVASTAMTALKVARGVAALVNAEKKYFDTSQSASIVNTGSIYPLTNMAQGTTYNTRDGNSIKLTSLLIRLRTIMNTASNEATVRFIVFIDKEYNNISTIQVTDVLENADYLNPVNHTNGKRFKILYDKYHVMSVTGTQGQYKRIFLKLNHHAKYADNSTTNQREGNMFVLAISDQATNQPGLAYYSRIRFLDN